MDRSFLSRPEVVAASRDFVCARLSTYEDKAEAEFLATVFTGRSGQLENTVFAILAPDGKTRLTRGGRSPQMALGERRGPSRSPLGGPPRERGDAGISKLIETMQGIAARYPAKAAAAKEPGAMPYVEDVRLGLNVAACDMLPTAILVAKDDAARKALEKHLRPLAWQDEFLGRFVWTTAKTVGDIGQVEGVDDGAALVIVQPDAYGMEGVVLAQAAKNDSAVFSKTLTAALDAHDPGSKDAGQHIREGRRKGVDWQTEVPVTDSHAPPRRR